MDSVAVITAVELYRFFHAGDSETRALRGVSLVINAGEFVAVTGPSGSGKSTLLACLAGIDEPDGGYVTIGNRRMSRRPENERAALRASGIGLLLQSGNMIDHLTVTENLEFARHLAGRGDHGINDRLAAVGVEQRAGALPSELSGGELARAGLALALVNDPGVLLADEPTGEVDEANEAKLLQLLREQASQGRAIVVVSHSPAVAKAADRRLTLVDGRLSDG